MRPQRDVRERASVMSVPAGLRIVVDNLLQNAAKAAAPGNSVFVRLERERSDWKLTVSNSGRLQSPHDGAAAAVASAATSSVGLGLGLSISRRLAGEAGGRLDLREIDGMVHSVLLWPAQGDEG